MKTGPYSRIAVAAAAVGVALLAAGVPAAADVANGVTVNRYAATARSYGANAYWLESADGIVLIDALMLKPDAGNLATVIASRGKPLAGIVLTHPHVDHFGGLGVLRARFPGVPIFATRGTAEAVQGVHRRAYEQGWIQAYGADYDETAVTPDRIVESGATLELAGMHLTVTSFGAMEAEDNAVVFSRELDAVFTGDAVMNGAVYYVGEGHSAGAIHGLERIAATYPAQAVAYPSHGDPGRLGAMVARDLAQVRFMREQVELAVERRGALLPEGRLSDAARARLIGIFAEHFREYLSYGVGVEVMATLNLRGLEAEILAERAAREP